VGLFNRTINADGRNDSTTSVNNVFEYFFKDAAKKERFNGQRTDESYHKGFNELLKDSLGHISNMLDGGLGIAMYMYIMGNQSTLTTNKIFLDKLCMIPLKQRDIAHLSKPTLDATARSRELEVIRGPGKTEDELIKEGKLFAENSVKYFKQMKYILYPNEDRRESLAWIRSSDLSDQSCPGEWGLKMRAKNHKAAARMLLRLPLMLNGMAPSHCRAQVQFIIKTLLAEPDPLTPRMRH
jgi:hypothetical protein